MASCQPYAVRAHSSASGRVVVVERWGDPFLLLNEAVWRQGFVKVMPGGRRMHKRSFQGSGGTTQYITLSRNTLVGVLCGAVLYCGVLCAAYRYIGKSEPAIVVAVYFHMSTALLSAVPLAFGWPQAWRPISFFDAICILGVAAGSFLGQLFMTRALQLDNASLISSLNFSQVRFCVLCGGGMGVLVALCINQWVGS